MTVRRLRLGVAPLDLERLGESAAAIARWAQRLRLPEALRHHLLLIHDELASNVVHHAAGASRLEISVELDTDLGRLRYRILDDGPPFDPLEREAPATDGALADRRPGGLGILLVRELSQAAHYRRRGARNRTTVDLPLSAPPAE
jgi:anti-sigma regulatory factor (Ser/Thr protein kinase)